MFSRIASSLAKVVLRLERTCETFKYYEVAASQMSAEMMERALRGIPANRDAVEVQLQSRTTKEVVVRRAGQSFDLEVELHGE